MATTSSIEDFTKDPDSTLDYVFDWSAWLPNGDTIAQSIWIVSAGLVVGDGVVTTIEGTVIPAPVHTTTNCTVWLSGGTSGQPYSVTNRIVTQQSRVDDRTITIRVEER